MHAIRGHHISWGSCRVWPTAAWIYRALLGWKSAMGRASRTISSEGRSRIMRAIRGKNTGPELLLRQQLRLAGITGYRIHHPKLPGSPDIAIGCVRLAVFVDGVFWHGHSSKFKKIRTEYWRQRIRKNMSRDRRIDRELKARGWTVMRVWDLDVLSDSAGIAKRIAAQVRSASLNRLDA